MTPTLLIADDEKATRDGLRAALEEEFDVFTASNVAEAMSVLNSEPIDLLLTDLRMGGDSGMDLLDGALSLPNPPVSIMMTAYGSVDTAVEAMRRGAWHFVTKPLNLDEVEMLLKRALRSRKLETENKQLRAQISDESGLDRLAGKSPAIRKVTEIVRQVAPTRATVLIEGESGTGKEVVAHAIHRLSGRPAEKLVIVHCAALSPQILESELFGHEKGSFTGATQRRIGRFEQADGGTLFLDEIGDLPLAMQSKLLRSIQERSVRPVGAVVEAPVNVRILSATHKDLSAEVAAGRFRQDLFYRLNVIQLRVPPLRERIEDVAQIGERVLQRIAQDAGVSPVPRLSADALELLSRYAFPGNVRELENLLHRALALSGGEWITAADLGLPEDVLDDSQLGAFDALEPAEAGVVAGLGESDEALDRGQSQELPADLAVYLDEVEREILLRALARHRFNRTAAGAALGLSLRQIRYRMARLGITAGD